MIIIRPVTYSDLDSLIKLADTAGTGLTTLPKEASLLEKKIARSHRSFSGTCSEDEEELFLFAMENSMTPDIVGICGIIASVGVEAPFFSMNIAKEYKASEKLGVSRELSTVTPKITRNGPAEICSLFLLHGYRKKNLGRLLSLSRFLFIAAFPERFKEYLIAEMRGFVDNQGHPPFWEHVGKHFYGMDFQTADLLTSEDKSFIAELMPSSPLYIECLPQEARDAIGKPHPNTIAALKLLEHEGFHWNHEVDIFDAGPQIAAQKKDIRIIKESLIAKVAGTFEESSDNKLYLLSNEDIDFRACYGDIKVIDNGDVLIPSDVAKNMNLEVGSAIRYVPTYH